MKKLFSIFILAVTTVIPAGVSRAQLAAPNETGVTMGHVHLVVQDLEAGKKFWLAMGGDAHEARGERGHQVSRCLDIPSEGRACRRLRWIGGESHWVLCAERPGIRDEMEGGRPQDGTRSKSGTGLCDYVGRSGSDRDTRKHFAHCSNRI